MLEKTPPHTQAKPPPDFDGFFRDEYPRLARACYLLTGGSIEAEDLAQEAFARTFERWDRVATMDSPSGYLFATVLNLNRKRVRRLTRQVRDTLSPNPTPDPAAVAEAKNEVLLALGSLPRTQREALVLVGWFDMDANEAGRVLGIDAASVRGRVHRARATIRGQLGDSDE
jgi:RNA polymerase sigma-70 factor, ECF subfamily